MSGRVQRASAPSFAGRLRELRAAAGLTQEELAERAGLTVYGVGALERGTRTRPYPHTVRALATALGLDDEQRRALLATLPPRGATPAEPAAPPVPPMATAPTDPDHAPNHRPLSGPTRLHGRDADLADLVSLLRHQRLVTLTGPGGVGKTRLATELAVRVAADHVDGAVVVPLAHVRDARQALVAVAQALALPAADTLTSPTALAAAVADRQLLLVLDNLEQVAGAGPAVADLVAVAQGLRVVATSRSALLVRAEVVRPVAPLAVPVGRPATLAALAEQAAGAMLLDRVAAASPQLALTDADAAVLAQLLHRVAGLPLAVELLAAPLGRLGPAEVLRRFEEVLGRAQLADLPERHRTLRATLDWSRDLLDHGDVDVLCRLAPFRGGFTLAAAEAVADGDPWPAVDRLVHHNLLHVERTAGGSVRYQLLVPVAEWAFDLLPPARRREVRDRHAAWVIALADAAAPEYTRTEQIAWLGRLDTEGANLAAALDWLLGEGADRTAAARLGWALWLYWWLRGLLRTGREAMEQALAGPLPPDVEARARLTHAAMTLAIGDLEASAPSWRRAGELAAAHGDRTAQVAAVAGAGLVLMQSGDLAGAEEHMQRAIALAEQDDTWESAWNANLAEVWLGTIDRALGDRAAARAHLDEGLARAVRRGDRLTAYIALFNLAELERTAGDHAAARAHLERAIRLTTETRDAANLAAVADLLAALEAADGVRERVPLLRGCGEAMREEAGGRVYGYYLPDEAEEQRVAAEVRAALGEERYDDLLDRGRGLGFDDVVAELLRR